MRIGFLVNVMDSGEHGATTYRLAAECTRRGHEAWVLSSGNLTLEVDEAALEFLIEKSFHEDFGARPLKRGIERWLEDPLSEEILKGNLDSPHKIKATAKDDEITFTMEKLPDASKEEDKEPAESET